MKIEIGKEFPRYFKPLYPEEFNLFHHFETTAGIPSVLFAITTWKENRKPNICFHAWSCFHGDRTAFFAVMGNLYQHTHTYANIKRDECFCINFLPISYYDRLVRTIDQNDYEADEFQIGDFTLSDGHAIHAPVIEEAPVNIECKVKSIQELGSHHMFLAEVTAVQVDETYMDEKGKFDLNRTGLIAYSHGEYLDLGTKLGTFGYSVRKKQTARKPKAAGGRKANAKNEGRRKSAGKKHATARRKADG